MDTLNVIARNLITKPLLKPLDVLLAADAAESGLNRG
jgi:hypothetical protein